MNENINVEEMMKKYEGKGFNEDQIKTIQEGLIKGLDVSTYTKLELDFSQMHEIRKGLEEGLDVSIYSNPEYTWQQMYIIRRDLEDKLNVEMLKHYIVG